MKNLLKKHWYVASLLAFLFFIILSFPFMVIVDFFGSFQPFELGIIQSILPFVLSLITVTILLWRLAPIKKLEKFFFLWVLSIGFIYLCTFTSILLYGIITTENYVGFIRAENYCKHLPIVVETPLISDSELPDGGYRPYYIPADPQYPSPYSIFNYAYYCTKKQAEAAHNYHAE